MGCTHCPMGMVVICYNGDSMIFIPIYNRAPNKLLRYETNAFDDGHGHTGTKRTAIFLDRKRRECKMTAQIIWDIKC